MTIPVGTVYAPQSPAQMFAGRRVNVGPFALALSNVHYLYATSGARAPILVRETPFNTTSTTLTQTDSSADLIDLDRYQSVLRCTRPLDLSGDSYRIEVRIFAETCEVDFRVYDCLSNTDLGTITVTQNNTTPGMATGTLDLSTAEATTGGEPRVLLVSVVGARFVTKGGGTTAYLYAAEALEIVADSTIMP